MTAGPEGHVALEDDTPRVRPTDSVPLTADVITLQNRGQPTIEGVPERAPVVVDDRQVRPVDRQA